MKIKNIVTVLLVAVILASCAPAVKVVPTETSVPTSTLTPVPTATNISTPIPTIDVEGLTIPDPQFSNPELFDFSNARSPIIQFAKVFETRPEDIASGLRFKIQKDFEGNDFVIMVTSDNIALLMAHQNEGREWTWQEATPGVYWGIQGKLTGFYIKSYHLKYLGNYLRLDKFANGGVIALSGQANPGPDKENKPTQASSYLRMAKENNVTFVFNYVVEPGKFPKHCTTENVDQWLYERLSDISDVIILNHPKQPVLLQFNEAWEGAFWNRDPNPIKDKYGEVWLEEYIYQTLSVTIEKGLNPNRDIVLMFNENGMYTNLAKQKLVHDKLVDSRMSAFNRLVGDTTMKTRLSKMNITKPDDIKILMGTEMHIKLGEKGDGHVFMPEPTVEQINALADYFEDLGGIIMTEVNPNGDDNQKAVFLAKLIYELKTNKNVMGFIVWNPVPDDENGQDIFKISPTFLFTADGIPTKLYYELLRY